MNSNPAASVALQTALQAESPLNVMVIGAGGVLGAAVHAGLEAEGHRVMGVGRSASQSRSRVRGPLVDLALPHSDLTRHVAEWQPDLCIHCAGPNSVPASVENPVTDFNGTVPPLLSVLEALRRHSPQARLIYVSSAAVYGQPDRLPVHESAAIAPISPYGFHRWQAELLVREYRELFGLRACAVRVFSAYGTTLRRQVVWDLCQRALRPGALQVSGTGRESRDFIHVDDVAQAIVLLGAQANWREVYNLGSGRETPIADLAHMIAARAGEGQTVQFSGQSIPGLAQRWCADTHAILALGFAPRVSLEQGVDEVWAACQAQSKEQLCT